MAHNPAHSYRDALRRARGRAGAIEVAAVRDIQRILQRYASNLERVIALGVSAAREAILMASMVAARQMDAELAEAIGMRRSLSFAQTVEIWERSMRRVARLEGVPFTTLGSVRVPPLTMLGQFAQLQAGSHWRTIIRQNAVNSGREASRIILAALQEGVGADELARRLRRYVSGAESFLSSFENVKNVGGEFAKLDLRRLDRLGRNATRKLVHSARRIAVSEMHNARSEAEIQHMASDPFIKAIQWTLSPIRASPGSSFVPPDQCDYLAVNDIWGLGPGIYPVTNVPPPPHPFDRCEKIPVVRERAEIAQPKPKGRKPSKASVVSGGTIPNEDRITPAAADRIRQNAWEAVSFAVPGYTQRRSA